MPRTEPGISAWHYLTGPLSRRLVVATVAVSILVSLLVSAAQLWLSYREQTAGAQRRLDEIGTSIVPSLAASLWLVDVAQVDLLLNGLQQLPAVAYIEIQTNEGETLRRGTPASNAFASRKYDLKYHEVRSFDLGVMRIELSDRQILSNLRSQAAFIALTSLITLACSSLVMLLLFQFWVTRHLSTMADYAQLLNFERLGRPLTLTGKPRRKYPDELDQVVHSINSMRETLISDLEARYRIEIELAEHRERLEELVVVRTSELLKLNQRLEILSTTDGLTGIANRRHFDQILTVEWNRAKRSKQPLALAMLDVDWFKKYNDHYGHQGGDECLRIIARTLAATICRSGDLVARYGGEEFAFIAPATNGANALLIAEKLCDVIRAQALPHELSAFGCVTASIGVAALIPEDADLPEALVKAADEALYRAKALGRNLATLGTPSEPTDTGTATPV